MWFSESGAEEAIVDQLNRLETDGLLQRSKSEGCQASRFIDLGTGNGHLLFFLREEDEDGKCWQGEMVGVDYSPASTQLAQRIASQRQVETIDFKQWDLLGDPPGEWLKDGFDVVLDKGTFDAISLMVGSSNNTSHPCERYREKVVPLIKPAGFLCITSCNWTRAELLEWLAPVGGELSFYSEARYPTYTFGGQTGQSIVTLLLQRNRAVLA